MPDLLIVAAFDIYKNCLQSSQTYIMQIEDNILNLGSIRI